MRKVALLIVLLAGALGAAPQLLPATDHPADEQPWMLTGWRKHAEPIMVPNPDPDEVDSRNVYNMATLAEDGKIRMIYRAESLREPAKSMTGRLCLAESADGVNFTRIGEPVLVPSEPYEKMGVEDPRLVKVGDTYYLTYSAWDGETARLCLATSGDLKSWTKHGPLFPERGWTKSGAILTRPIDGRYVMYFGDTDIWMATSEDLVHWTAHEPPVFSPREGHFDNVLVEPGPPPLITEDGILLIYNAAGRFPETGDRLIYAAGQILFDPEQPDRVLERSRHPFLSVTREWEREGYVDDVVFAEGLVQKGGEWLLYYGGGDRVIGLARAPIR